MSLNVGEAVVRTVLVLDSASATRIASDAQKTISSSMRRVGQGVSAAGVGMSQSLTLPLSLASASVVKMAADFEREMIRVGIATETPVEQLGELESKARELGASTVFGATDAAEAMSALGRAGFDTNEILASIEGTLGLAATENMDLGRASEITAAALRGMGLEADQAGRVADALAVGSNASLASVEGLGTALGYVAGSARTSGLSLEQTVGALSAMSDAGIDASRSGTGLRQLLRGLNNPTDKLAKQLKKFNIEIENSDGSMRDFEAIMNDVGKAGPAAMRDIGDAMTANAGEALLALGQRARKSGDDLSGLIDEVGATEGAAVEMGNKLRGGTSGALEELSSSIEDLALSIAETGLLEQFTELVRKVTDFVRNVSKSNPELIKLGVLFLGIAAAIGPALVALGAVITAVGTIAPLFSALLGPVGLVILGIAALAAAFTAAWRNSQGFRDFITAFGKTLLGFGRGFVDGFLDALAPVIPIFQEKVIPALQAFGRALDKAMTFIAPIMVKVIPYVQKFGEVLGWVFGKSLFLIFTAVVAVFRNFYLVGKGVFDLIIGVINGDLRQAVQGLVEIFHAPMRAVLEIIDTVFGTNVVESMEGVMTAMIDGITTILGGSWEDLAKLFVDGLGIVVDAVKDFLGISSPSKVFMGIATDIFLGLINGALAMIGSVVDTMTKIFNAVINALINLPRRLLGIGRDMVSRLASGASAIVGRVISVLNGLRNRAIFALVTLPGRLYGIGRDAVSRLASGISSLINSVVSRAASIKNRVYNAVSGITSRFYNLGRDIVQGMINGIRNYVGGLARQAADMARSALNAAKNILESRSPSKAFFRVGEDSGEGFSLGMESSTPRVTRSARDMAGGALEGGRSAAPSRTGVPETDRGKVEINQNYYGPQTGSGKLTELTWTIQHSTALRGFGDPAVAL